MIWGFTVFSTAQSMNNQHFLPQSQPNNKYTTFQAQLFHVLQLTQQLGMRQKSVRHFCDGGINGMSCDQDWQEYDTALLWQLGLAMCLGS
jgi:hypothetical protein